MHNHTVGYVIINDDTILTPNLEGGLTGVVDFEWSVTSGDYFGLGTKFTLDDLTDFYCICNNTSTTSELTFSAYTQNFIAR